MKKSQQLQEKIRQRIAEQGGCLSFALFMQMALYEPGLGYYVSGLRKIGAEGDFVTAPEISPLFSRCIAKQCEQMSGANILEFGAGSGVMAADILLSLENLPEHYYIIEVSPDLRLRQEETLRRKCPHLLERVQWLQALPKQFSGIVLANEVLDAMPVHLFTIHNQQAYELGVTLRDDQFALMRMQQYVPIPEGLDLPEGYQSERCLAVTPWLQDLYAAMQQGIVLLIDYGFSEHVYYHPDRYMGTLMCHYQHRAHTDPFIHIGLQDITAHVNFTDVARAAQQAGFTVSQRLSQANFLISSGIENMLDQYSDEFGRYRQAQALKCLLMPGEMGELFQVMLLVKTIN